MYNLMEFSISVIKDLRLWIRVYTYMYTKWKRWNRSMVIFACNLSMGNTCEFIRKRGDHLRFSLKETKHAGIIHLALSSHSSPVHAILTWSIRVVQRGAEADFLENGIFRTAISALAKLLSLSLDISRWKVASNIHASLKGCKQWCLYVKRAVMYLHEYVKCDYCVMSLCHGNKRVNHVTITMSSTTRS